MPLINQPQINIGDIAANPYLAYDPNWVAFDLIVENGDVVLYNAMARHYNDFQFDPPSTDVDVIVPFVNSDWGDSNPIAGDLNGLLFPPGNILGLKTSGLTTPFSRDAYYSFIWTHNFNQEAAISKQTLNLHSATNMALGVHPLGTLNANGGGDAEVIFSQGIQLTSGGYWESSDTTKIDTDQHRQGCVFAIVSDSPIADISFSLSGYAEIRQIIGA